ncbi:glycolate oxidase [Skeletonema marinoi]|uniref:Glycolate oxidase n=1 Tax=Skeletonema marinoi TaxID=267567 RepID=A0AAD8Y078_9STRA|nr:glycolate oxidase [Skeletonema marinoi]
MSEEAASSAAMISMITESPTVTASTEHKICNASDYQIAARSLLPTPLYEYLASGTDDEQTLAENESAFKYWYLRPRVMRPVGSISTAVTLFGQKLALPVFISPAGVHALCDEVHGECASARAAQRAGTLFGLSQHATRSIEQVADACDAAQGRNANLWYQCYILKDRDMTLRLVRRAANAVIEVFPYSRLSSIWLSRSRRKEWMECLPEPHRLVNYDEEIANKPQSSESKKSSGLVQKQVHHDRRRCYRSCNAGADGVMVSNHGGRGLDGALAAIDALPEVVAAVGDKVPVLMDSGVRRGTDVLKALALGASAVGIGKPVFFALAVGGENAVVNLLQILQREVEAAMAICGVESVADAKRSLVTRHPNGGVTRYTRSKL